MNRGLYYKPLSPSTIVGGCIAVYENAWPNADHTIESVEQECQSQDSGINWSRATTIGQGIYQNARTNLNLGVTRFVEEYQNSTMIDIHNQFLYLINSAVIEYSNIFGIHEHFFHEGYNMLKYQSGQEYKAHYDGTTFSNRHISCLCYLNDDYTGGELEFPNFNLKIRPQKGMLIVFPSNFAYSHIAKPIISGTKYALVTWLHDCPIQ